MTSRSTCGRAKSTCSSARMAPGSRPWSRSSPGIYQPDAGEILLDGSPVTLPDPHAAQQLGISTVHQELNLVPHLDVGRNMYLGREPLRGAGVIDWPALYRGAAAQLAALGMSFDPHTQVRSLGVALQQMTEIAKALVAKARVLILDEPTAAITADEADQLFRIVDALRDQGAAIIFISHHLEDAARIGDRVTVLRDGKLRRHPADGGDDAARADPLDGGSRADAAVPSAAARSGSGRAEGDRVEPPGSPQRHLLRGATRRDRWYRGTRRRGTDRGGASHLRHRPHRQRADRDSRPGRPDRQSARGHPQPAWRCCRRTASSRDWCCRSPSPTTSPWPRRTSCHRLRVSCRRSGAPALPIASSRRCAFAPRAHANAWSIFRVATSKRWCWRNGC